MPRRELLSSTERESLLVIPTEESEQIRHYTLNRADLAFIRQHRWGHNRLGVAVQLCYLRYPGRVLNRGETPPSSLLGMAAAQLRVSSALWEKYAERDQTRREHQQELVRRVGLAPFTGERAIAGATRPKGWRCSRFGAEDANARSHRVADDSECGRVPARADAPPGVSTAFVVS